MQEAGVGAYQGAVEAERTKKPPENASYRLAQGLAYLVNPLVLPPVLFGTVLTHFHAPLWETGWVVLVGFVFFGVIPLGYLLWLLRHCRVASLEVRCREHRARPFLVALASSLLALVLIAATGVTARALVSSLAACTLLNVLLLLLITLRWKISVHAAAVAGFITTLLFVAQTSWSSLQAQDVLLTPASVFGLLPVLPAVMWARVYAGAHTRAQVSGGALFGLVVPYAELYLLLHAGTFVGLL